MFNNNFFKNLLKNPAQLGLEENDLKNYNIDRKKDIILGEYFAKVSKVAGRMAANFLYRGRWGDIAPEWYDHRIHFLYPEKTFNDYWCITAVNAIQKLPLGGKVLDICSGDGFFAYYFYRTRAKHIDCIEISSFLCKHSQKHHSADNINYICADILEHDISPENYDIIVMRSAIEHFSEINQNIIFQKVRNSLKNNGWFLGETPANPEKNTIMLKSHENEWTDEAEMRKQMQNFFSHIECMTLKSKDQTQKSADRTNLFWCCRK